MTASEVGRWDPDLFARFRAASGEERRRLKGELLRVNLPLVKILVGQVAGIADEKVGSRRRNIARVRVPGAEQAEWDDLLQMGLEGMAAALEKFDPSRGKISTYARWWVLTKIQRFVRREHLIRVPESHREERPAVALLGDEEALERSGASEEMAAAGIAGLTEETVERWLAEGFVPRSIEEAEGRIAETARRRIYSTPRDPLACFLDRCTIVGRRADRAPLWPLWNAWRLDCLQAGRPQWTRRRLVEALAPRGVRPVTVVVRFRGRAVGSAREDGLAGLRLVWPLTP